MLAALALIVSMMEKVSVLVAVALVLVLLRPAQSWLEDAGATVSLRRKIVLVTVFTPLAIWGLWLGFEVGGTRFNTRAIGIIVAGYLGGARVGALVGFAAGLANAAMEPLQLAPLLIGASVINGLIAGLWVRRYGTGLVSLTVGAIVAQLGHHISLGGLYLLVSPEQALATASNIGLHAAKITANAIGVVLFMGLLNLTRELERARTDASISRTQVRDARLETLQYQLRPHFLFNLLNTLAYLIRTDPARARALTLDLADFLRYTLSRGDEQTSLEDELEQITRYLELERARFGEELHVVRQIDARLASEVHVPPLLLQPLVENAIQHAARDGKLTITLRAWRDDHDTLYLQVLDDGPGPPSPAPAARTRGGGGVGLQNVRERLDRFYQGRASLSLIARPDAEPGACAQILITPPRPRHHLADAAREQLRKAVISSRAS